LFVVAAVEAGEIYAPCCYYFSCFRCAYQTAKKKKKETQSLE